MKLIKVVRAVRVIEIVKFKNIKKNKIKNINTYFHTFIYIGIQTFIKSRLALSLEYSTK